MTTTQEKQLTAAADNALRLLNQIKTTLGPIAALNLALAPQDVKRIHELARDAAAPLRAALAAQTLRPVLEHVGA